MALSKCPNCGGEVLCFTPNHPGCVDCGASFDFNQIHTPEETQPMKYSTEITIEDGDTLAQIQDILDSMPSDCERVSGIRALRGGVTLTFSSEVPQEASSGPSRYFPKTEPTLWDKPATIQPPLAGQIRHPKKKA